MLVDLGRNDLGRVSTPGTVEVTRLIQKWSIFSHVMHMVSEVQGKLAADKDAIAALQACFTGTIKRRAEGAGRGDHCELEEEPRGVYAGAVGYFDFRGSGYLHCHSHHGSGGWHCNRAGRCWPL